MKKRKICFIVASPGTAASFLKRHMQRLSAHFEVHLAAHFQDEKDMGQFEGISCHAVCIERQIHVSADMKAVGALWRLFRREKFFAVHSVTPKAGLVTALAARLAGVRNRIHIYTGQVWATRRGFMRYMLQSFDKLIACLNTHLLVDGYSQRRFLLENGVVTEENSQVMGEGSISGVDTRRFAFSPALREDIRKELKLRDEQVVFVFLGRMNQDKGMGELLAAFDRLAAEEPQAFLLLVGGDEEGWDARVEQYPHIRREENYHYYGLTRQPERLLHAGDVFVLPSYREGFGSSVIEASCVGLPVICSDAYGVMDAMVDNVTGLRCRVADTDSLYACMKELYASPERRRELGAHGHERVVKLFSSEVIESAWEDFYLSL